jgi:hypothetical protein
MVNYSLNGVAGCCHMNATVSRQGRSLPEQKRLTWVKEPCARCGYVLPQNEAGAA